VYTVDSRDRVIELRDVPQSSVGAPCPIVVASELELLVAYFVHGGPMLRRALRPKSDSGAGVSLRGEQLVMLEKLLRNSLDALSSAADALTRMRLSTDTIPAILRAATEPMRVLAEYARRGRDALARLRPDRLRLILRRTSRGCGPLEVGNRKSRFPVGPSALARV